MSDVGGVEIQSEEVPLVKDVGFSGFDNLTYDVAIDQNSHYAAVSVNVEDRTVLAENGNDVTSNANYESLHANEHGFNQPLTEEVKTESMVEEQQRPETGKKEKSRVWHLAYYQEYFDLSTDMAVKRLIQALWPGKNDAFIFDRAQNRADLYCPFWISVTLAFLVATMSNVSKWLGSSSDELENWESDVTKLANASFTLFSFYFVAATVIYAVFRYTGNPRIFVEILSVYGYSLTVYLPSALLMIPPSPVWQWFVIILSCCISTEFIVGNLCGRTRSEQPALNWQDGSAWTCLILMVIVHTSLALVIKLWFFTIK